MCGPAGHVVNCEGPRYWYAACTSTASMRVLVIALALQACAFEPAIGGGGTTDVLASCRLGEACTTGGGTAGAAADVVIIAALSSVAALLIYKLLADR